MCVDRGLGETMGYAVSVGGRNALSLVGGKCHGGGWKGRREKGRKYIDNYPLDW